MKKYFLLISFLFVQLQGSAQSDYKVSYDSLTEYQGVYEYTNNSTLKIAASPRDIILYAIINQSRYPLKPLGKDVFTNSSNEKVTFKRDINNRVIAYTVGNETFNLLNSKVNLPESMWYPRPKNRQIYPYRYSKPVAEHDGITVSEVQKPLDKCVLERLVNEVANDEYPNVHSLLIMQHGKLVFEEYFYEYNKDSLHQMRSASKSVVSALTGIALQNGDVKDLQQSVTSYFPEYGAEIKTGLKDNITIENLLTNQSGLDCDISNDSAAGNETAMGQSDDWVKYTLQLPMSDVPGGKGMYCSGNPIILGRIIEKSSAMPLSKFAERYLFGPLGVKDFKWDFKPNKSNAEDFCQVYLRPRDMAKFGQLYLNRGMWDGKQILSTEWVENSVSLHSTIQNVGYGYLWWIKYIESEGVRYNGFAAQGNGGQRIFVFPRQDIVIVITGGNYNQQSPSDKIIADYILKAYNKKH
ncbi:serine hydrolase [Flavobacterium sp.]|uniref:serine hydrolase domain-containing protein n=1 Tax=Flavobacterium sp. TaxID=239 RepID=UPI002610BDD9|nr:serine hydrolase [Flavobacterium sp.]